MSIGAVAVRRWAGFLAGRPFGQRIRLLPIGATIALAVVFALNLGLGFFNSWRLTKIEQRDYPSVRDSRAMNETLAALQVALQNAVAAQDTDRLAATDTLRRVFRAHAASLASHHGAVRSDSSFADRFDRYYLGAYRVSHVLIKGSASGDSVSKAVGEMVTEYKSLRTSLADNVV